MRFREIKVREIRDETKKDEKYKKIKPETDMTVEEARSYLDSLFNLPEEIVDPDGVDDLPNEILF